MITIRCTVSNKLSSGSGSAGTSEISKRTFLAFMPMGRYCSFAPAGTISTGDNLPLSIEYRSRASIVTRELCASRKIP